MSINKKYVMAGALAAAAVMPLVQVDESHASETYTTTANVHFRTGAGTNTASLGVLPKGTNVEVTSTSNGWSKVNYNSKTGYVSAQYLKVGGSSSNGSSTTTTRYVNASVGLNVRSGPSTSYSRVGTLANKTQVTVVSTSGSWSKIQSGSLTGYVSNSYLTSTAPSKIGRASCRERVYVLV